MHRDTERATVIVLAAATGKEMAAALAGISPADAQLPFVPGGAVRTRLAEREVDLLVTGVGPVASAATLSAHLARTPDVAGVLNVGLAGAYAEQDAGSHGGAGVPLGALVVAGSERLPEYGIAGEFFSDAAQLGFAQLDGPEGPVTDSITLYPEASARAMGLTLPDAVQGAFATVAGVSATKERAAAIASRFGVVAESMEGFSLALTCALHNVPFLQIRAISNVAGSRAAEDWDVLAGFSGLELLMKKLFYQEG